jgi:hypothetical protein
MQIFTHVLWMNEYLGGEDLVGLEGLIIVVPVPFTQSNFIEGSVEEA